MSLSYLIGLGLWQVCHRTIMVSCMKNIRVLIADDHTIARSGLCSFLEVDADLEVVAVVANGQEAVEQTCLIKPDVVLLDLELPVISGIEATALILQQMPDVLIIILIENLFLAQTLHSALTAGANGVLLKDLDSQELCHSIKSVSKNQVIFSPLIAQYLANPSKTSVITYKIQLKAEIIESLTEREQDVLRLLATGLTNKEIAYHLNLSEKTIKVHVSVILAKLGVQSRTQAAMFALQNRLYTD